MKNLAVFFGGVSLEHEVSIITALQLMEHVDTKKYNLIPVYIDKKGNWWTGEKLTQKSFFSENKNSQAEKYLSSFTLDPNEKSDIDASILCFHGGLGEGGEIQGVLDAAQIPYQGPDMTSSAICMDKIIARQILKAEKIAQPEFSWFNNTDYTQDKKKVFKNLEISLPFYLKVAKSGSSIGVKRITTEKEFYKAMEELSLYGERFIVEAEVTDCIEVNLSIMGTHDDIKVSSSEQPIKSDELLSFEDKYTRGGKKSGMASASRRIPAPISIEAENKLKELAKKIFTVLNLEGVVRIDFFVNPSTEESYVIEINTIPGSLSFYLWEHEGINFTQLVDKLVAIAEKRQKRKQKTITTFDNNLLSNLK